MIDTLVYMYIKYTYYIGVLSLSIGVLLDSSPAYNILCYRAVARADNL